MLAAVLVLVGALNWGLVAIAEFDLVATVFGMEFGETNVASRIVYGLVGLAGVYGVVSLASRRSAAATRPARTSSLALTEHKTALTRKDFDMRKSRFILALLAVAAVAAAAMGSSASADTRKEGDIVSTAMGAGQFTTLASLLKKAGRRSAPGQGAVPSSPRPTRRSRKCPSRPSQRSAPIGRSSGRSSCTT